MNDKTLSVCNQKKQLPFFFFLFIKEKLGLSTQKTFHSVDLFLCFHLFLFPPVSCGHHFHHFTMFNFLSSFPARGKQVPLKPKHFFLIPAPFLLVCPLYFLSLRFVCCLVVTETLLRSQARTGAQDAEMQESPRCDTCF